MTQQEYLQKMFEIRNTFNKLNEDQKLLQHNYIEEHALYHNGDKVLAPQSEFRPSNDKKVAAFVDTIYIDDNGVIRYRLKKCKKDGTVSSFRQGYSSFTSDNLEKYNTDKKVGDTHEN